MRKSLFLTLVLSLCVADFGAFAATAQRGNARGSAASANSANATTQQNAAPVSARAGARQKVVSAPTTTSSASAPVSARAGARQKVVTAPVTSAKTSSTGGVAARAATKKALSMGTKVAAATENTVVSQECQNAYYGCMDAFCMLDNATGGRCQCSDRNAELDAVLDEIMLIDEQSARIATEGVEQIQMGEYASQINSKAKSVESGITASKNSSSSSTKGSSTAASRSLNLEALAATNFFDVEEDSAFDDGAETSLVEDISNKSGDALQKAAAKVCVAQAPAECKSSLSMLQMAYVQKVKSDCVGYENALKQQRSSSQQKLLTAQKAVRDAALDEVRKQNRYETAGECAIAFAQCMQTTAECGSDYTGCVTLAAAENVKNTKKGSKAAQYTIKGIVSGADITIATSTMEALLAKKEICASVTKQCVNANKNDAVWDIFLRNVAPTLKSAELIAEQNLRSSCLPTVAECFRNACKSQFGEDDESYDICLSNPATYKALCKVQLEPCLEATGGNYEKPQESSLWNGLIAMLESMKVDVCTKEVKDCLLSEDRCGKDYSGCIGLDTPSIMDLCPVEKLTACVTDGRYATKMGEDGKISLSEENKTEIRNYVARVAQGLALNIENNFATVCQNAAEAALVKVCGDGGSDEEGAMCPNLDLDVSGSTSKMHVAYQDKSSKEYYDSVDEYINLNALNSSNMKNLFNLKPIIKNQMDIYGIKYNGENINNNKAKTEDGNEAETEVCSDYFCYSKTDATFSVDNGYMDTPSELLSEINSKYSLLLNQIKSDPKVTYCMTGRQIEGFDGKKFGKQLNDKGEAINKDGRFPNLLKATEQQLASQILNTVFKKYNEDYREVDEKLKDEYQNLAERLADYVSEAELDKNNEELCKKFAGYGFAYDYGLSEYSSEELRVKIDAKYDKGTNQCVLTLQGYYCAWINRYRERLDDETVKKCQTYKDPAVRYIDMSGKK